MSKSFERISKSFEQIKDSDEHFISTIINSAERTFICSIYYFVRTKKYFFCILPLYAIVGIWL